MNGLRQARAIIGAITDLGLMLLGLAIIAAILIGPTLPFFGGVVANLVGVVKQLGDNGLVGLIAAGVVIWLFSKRALA